MAELKNQGLYIVKTYCIYNNKLVPVIKFGYTKNIKVRLKHFGNKYKLIKFFLCDFPKEREDYIKEYWYNEEFRLNKNEHFIFETGNFKFMYNALIDAQSYKITKDKNNNYTWE